MRQLTIWYVDYKSTYMYNSKIIIDSRSVAPVMAMISFHTIRTCLKGKFHRYFNFNIRVICNFPLSLISIIIISTALQVF